MNQASPLNIHSVPQSGSQTSMVKKYAKVIK